MKLCLSACFLALLLTSTTVAQTSKSWTEWTKKDIDKMLNDSAWGQTQTESRGGGGGGAEGPSQSSVNGNNNPAMSTTTAMRREDSNVAAAGRVESGEQKAPSTVKFHVRFLSAKPVRAAFARQVMLAQAQPNDALTAQLQQFVDRDFAEYIVVSVGIEVGDQKMATPLMNAFSNATIDALKESVYLERKDGKKLFLMEYRAPVGDGMGAKFVFKRVVDGQPFLSANDSVKFVAQFNEKMKFNTHYKLSEMMYDGKLEY